MDMREMVDLLNRYAREYYELDEPTVSDKEYDDLYYRLKALEEETGVTLPDSPTHRVGGAPQKAFVSYKHRQKLYYFDKAKDENELNAYLVRVEKFCGEFPKMTL